MASFFCGKKEVYKVEDYEDMMLEWLDVFPGIIGNDYTAGNRIQNLSRQKQLRLGDYSKLQNYFKGINADKKFNWVPVYRELNKQMMQWNDRESFEKKGIPFLFSLIGHNEQVKIWLPESNDIGIHYCNKINKVSLSYAVKIGSITYCQPILFKKWKIMIKNGEKAKYRYYKSVPIVVVLSLLDRLSTKIWELREEDIYLLSFIRKYIMSLFQVNWKVESDIPEIIKEKFLEYGYKEKSGVWWCPKEDCVTWSSQQLLEGKEMSIAYSLLCLLNYSTKFDIETYLTHQSLEPKYRNGVSDALNDFMSISLYYLKDYYTSAKSEIERRTNFGKKIATAYITKKNIPIKIQEAMEQSSFHKFFDFVEFDESADMEKIKKVEQECQVLMERNFSKHIYKGMTLRIRKLGKHHAAGLYYTGFNTLCVDVRYPNSFIHEYFHLIDDQNNNLSLKSKFHEIKERYSGCIHQLAENSEAKSRLKSHSKYNLNYYLVATEVFARCGEIYLFRIKGIESSLLKTDESDSFAYPKDKKLEELIEEYYSKLLEGNYDKRK